MSKKTLYVCVVCTLVSSFAIGEEITRPHLMAAAKLGNVRLFHKDNNFVVEQDGEEKDIQPCFVSSELRNISPELLSQFLLADNYLKLGELNNSDGSVDYKLDACSRLKGGGPWFGGIVFIGGSIATVGATVGAVIIATPGGPAAMGAAGVATAYSGMAVTAKATVAATAAPTP